MKKLFEQTGKNTFRMLTEASEGDNWKSFKQPGVIVGQHSAFEHEFINLISKYRHKLENVPVEELIAVIDKHNNEQIAAGRDWYQTHIVDLADPRYKGGASWGNGYVYINKDKGNLSWGSSNFDTSD